MKAKKKSFGVAQSINLTHHNAKKILGIAWFPSLSRVFLLENMSMQMQEKAKGKQAKHAERVD